MPTVGPELAIVLAALAGAGLAVQSGTNAVLGRNVVTDWRARATTASFTSFST